jgi:hypothetical protein
MNPLHRLRRHAQPILAFSLLAFQIWIPWSVPRLATEDGPSHLYTAVVARNLLLHPESPYAWVYRLNPRVIPNWGATVVLGGITAFAGVDHAEQIFMTLALLAGFFSIAYAIRAISPDVPAISPLNNFLLQTWFL